MIHQNSMKWTLGLTIIKSWLLMNLIQGTFQTVNDFIMDIHVNFVLF